MAQLIVILCAFAFLSSFTSVDCVRRNKSTFTGKSFNTQTQPNPILHSITESEEKGTVEVEEKKERGEEGDSYSEYLLLRTVGDGKKDDECNMFAHFHFAISTSFSGQLTEDQSPTPSPSLSSFSSSSTSSSAHSSRKTSFDLFPGSLGGVVQLYGIEEFHISFTSGRWPSRFAPPVLPASHGGDIYLYFC